MPLLFIEGQSIDRMWPFVVGVGHRTARRLRRPPARRRSLEGRQER
jgi:hypothetical protein